MSKFTISQASKLSGLSPKMIRDYEAKGIVPARFRSSAGYRMYEQCDIDQLRFIARTRHLGFSLKQSQALLLLWQDQDRLSADVKQLADQHIADLELKAQQLLEMAQHLRELSQSCAGDESPECTILKGIENPL